MPLVLMQQVPVMMGWLPSTAHSKNAPNKVEPSWYSHQVECHGNILITTLALPSGCGSEEANVVLFLLWQVQ